MPKAIKYYSDEEIEQKYNQFKKIRAQRKKEKQKKEKELLDRGKIAYVDLFIEYRKNEPNFNSVMHKRVKGMIEGLTDKDLQTKKALEEFLKLFPVVEDNSN